MTNRKKHHEERSVAHVSIIGLRSEVRTGKSSPRQPCRRKRLSFRLKKKISRMFRDTEYIDVEKKEGGLTL
jgi:hypothetical protein